MIGESDESLHRRTRSEMDLRKKKGREQIERERRGQELRPCSQPMQSVDG
jgi:hypothetical protein